MSTDNSDRIALETAKLIRCFVQEHQGEGSPSKMDAAIAVTLLGVLKEVSEPSAVEIAELRRDKERMVTQSRYDLGKIITLTRENHSLALSLVILLIGMAVIVILCTTGGAQ